MQLEANQISTRISHTKFCQFTFLYFVSRRHEDERKKKAGPFRPGLWCSALRIYLGKSSSATSATLRSPYIAR